ncbi:2-oxoglutarate-dependent dioxygenase [Acrasis kona]|uniref:2-oxoglutarate-dependent dioxygenase n=1 Tax=Acrasis kona TaxID=1008807 RepID=A0AAW2ZLA9_9EUKA
MSQTVTVVNIDYQDLLNGKDLVEEIHNAYGKDGLGILTVSGVPNYEEYRNALLPQAHTFATLEEDIKNKYVDASSNYSFGWSHGKERFNGRPDTFKGSFYANPQHDVKTTDEALIKEFPFYCRPNIWPSEHVPTYEDAFKKLGTLIVQVGILVAGACDRYVQKSSPTYVADKLKSTIEQSKTTKARLLYYFPTTNNSDNVSYAEDNLDSWCGWHLDHGSLTGLTKAIFLNEKGDRVENNDKKAGLYIKNRVGEIVKATWKDDQLAFQIGESAQVHSGGILRATPHCVRGSSELGVARATLAVFMQPQWDATMDTPTGVDVKDSLIDVLKQGMDFNMFTKERLAQYY